MSQSWWDKLFRSKRPPSRRPNRANRLSLERLEDRIVPIIGAFAEAALAPLGDSQTSFTGVVMLNRLSLLNPGVGTGSLINTEQHIITAAHVADATAPILVSFQLTRNDPTYNVPINMVLQLLVPPNSQFPHPAFNPNNISAGNDIAVMVLPDQEPGQGLANRHLVAPFGAQRYYLNNWVNEQNAEVTLVGYGEDGRGNDGNYTDEVQRLTIENIPNGVGSFTLTLFPPGGGQIQTLPISTDGLTADRLAQAFVDRGVPQANIHVMLVAATATSMIFDIRFTEGYGARNIAELGAEAVPPMTVTIAERWPGRTTFGTKRMGRNTLDGFQTYNVPGNQFVASNIHLALDFDNGQAANNAIAGSNLGVAPGPYGFGEVGVGRGDSGGPAFLWNATQNRWEIAGIISFGASPGSPTDVTDYRNSANNRSPDSSFGELAFLTRVTQFTDWVNQQIAGNYDLVLDMQQQILGRDVSPITGNPILEQYTITARRNGANLELVVNDPQCPECSGVYFSQPAANILSLTIRGADDDETIRIEGNLWQGDPVMPRSITIIGRGGNDTIVIGSETGGDLAHYSGAINVQGGTGSDRLIINDVAPTIGQAYTVSATTVERQGSPPITYETTEALTLNTGSARNKGDAARFQLSFHRAHAD